MVQAEAGFTIDETMEPEETAGGVTNDDVSKFIALHRHTGPFLGVKQFMVAPEAGAAAIDLNAFFGHRLALRIVQDKAGV